MLLIAKAYRILARRFKTPFGEIDIVARRRSTLVLRRGQGADERRRCRRSSDRTRQVRILGAAEFWLAQHPRDADCEIRFDVILATPGKMPRHIANAFDATR